MSREELSTGAGRSIMRACDRFETTVEVVYTTGRGSRMKVARDGGWWEQARKLKR